VLNARPAACAARHQRGVSLIEVLVTIVVLSVGLLGTASLQLTTLQTHQRAYSRTQATNIAYTIADLARANRSAVLSGGVDDAVIAAWTASGDDVLVDAKVDLDVTDAATGAIRITVSWLDDRTDVPADEEPEDGGEEDGEDDEAPDAVAGEVSFTLDTRI